MLRVGYGAIILQILRINSHLDVVDLTLLLGNIVVHGEALYPIILPPPFLDHHLVSNCCIRYDYHDLFVVGIGIHRKLHTPGVTFAVLISSVDLAGRRPGRSSMERLRPRKTPLQLQQLVHLLLRSVHLLRRRNSLLPDSHDQITPCQRQEEALHSRHLLARSICMRIGHCPVCYRLQNHVTHKISQSKKLRHDKLGVYMGGD